MRSIRLSDFLQNRSRRNQRRVAQAAEAVERRVLLCAGCPDVDFGTDGLQPALSPETERVATSPIDFDVSGDRYYGVAKYETVGFQLYAMDHTGQPVSVFGGGAVYSSDFGFDFPIDSIAAQLDGKLVVGGGTGQPGTQGDFKFSRLNADGTLDTSFGTNGIQTIDGSFADYDLTDIDIKEDGKIVAVGTSELFTGEEYIALIQLNTSGAPDPNFGDGRPGLNLGGFNTNPREVMFDTESNRIVVASLQAVPGQNYPNIAVHQFLEDGLEDVQFGSGNAVVEVGSFNEAEVVESATLSGGWIYVAGYRFNPDTLESEDFVARVSRGPGNDSMTTGVWDEDFGGDGFLGVNQISLSLLDAPDGGFYVAGDTGISNQSDPENAMAIAKYRPNGTLDRNFGDRGVSEISVDGWAYGEAPLLRDGSNGLVLARDVFSGLTDEGPIRAELHVARFLETSQFAVLNDGVLTVRGTAESDSISVTQKGSQVTATVNGTKALFDAGDIQQIEVFAGEGNDKVKATGANPVTVYGDGGNDNIKGSNGPDTIFGGAGNDIINGGNGRDSLFGEEGSDKINGGNGDDYLSGDIGRDLIKGGSGDDVVYAGGGSDKVIGGKGNDELYGEAGHDNITGGGDSDTIYGGAGNDTLKGNGGADSLFGEEGIDALFGSAKQDLLDFGPQ
ncbi:MAG: hypothetical protein AB8G99_16780 [Planctomycetaceae bacterium]